MIENDLQYILILYKTRAIAFSSRMFQNEHDFYNLQKSCSNRILTFRNNLFYN